MQAELQEEAEALHKLEVEDDLEFPKTLKQHSRTVVIHLEEDVGEGTNALEESKQSI